MRNQRSWVWTVAMIFVLLTVVPAIAAPEPARASGGKLTLVAETFADAAFTQPKTEFRQTERIYVRISLRDYELVSTTGIEQIGFRVYYPNQLGTSAAHAVGAAAANLSFSSADLPSDSDFPGKRAASFELYDKYQTVTGSAGPGLVADPLVSNGVLATFQISTKATAPLGAHALVLAKASLTTYNGDAASPATSVRNPVSSFVTLQDATINIVATPGPQPDPGGDTGSGSNPPAVPLPAVEDGVVTLPISGRVEQDASGKPVAESYEVGAQAVTQINQAKAQGATTVQFTLGTATPAASTLSATVPASVLAAAAQGTPISLVIETAAGGITLPPALVQALAAQNQPLTLTAERLPMDAVTDQLPANSEAVAEPLRIETAIRGRTLVSIPMSIQLPIDLAQRQAVLSSYLVYAQHSDGTDQSIADLAFDLDESVTPPVLRGIGFSVEQFSTFTLVRTVSTVQPEVSVLTTRVGTGSYQFGAKTFATEPCYYLGSDTMMTLRMLEQFGVRFKWDAASKTATLLYQEKTIHLTVGAGIASVNGASTRIVAASGRNIAPEIRNGRISVPLRFVSEQLGFKVQWAAHLITIKP